MIDIKIFIYIPGLHYNFWETTLKMTLEPVKGLINYVIICPPHPLWGLQSLRTRTRKKLVQFWSSSCVILPRQVNQCEYHLSRTGSKWSNDGKHQATITQLFCPASGCRGHSLKHTLCSSWKRSWMASVPQLLNREASRTPMSIMSPMNR